MSNRFDDQVSIASAATQTSQSPGLPRSTSTNDLFDFPGHCKRKYVQNNVNGVTFPRTMSIPDLAQIPEHRTQHRMTPYQLQRKHMKQSFQFPNGENFTPRKQLPKSASCVSLDKQRAAPTARAPPRSSIPRSSSMVTVSLSESSKTHQNNNLQRLPEQSHARRPGSDSDHDHAIGADISNGPRLTSSMLDFNRLHPNYSHVSLSSVSNKQTSSSQDSRSTSNSIKEACVPGSTTSTDISDEDLAKHLVVTSKLQAAPVLEHMTQQVSDEATITEVAPKVKQSFSHENKKNNKKVLPNQLQRPQSVDRHQQLSKPVSLSHGNNQSNIPQLPSVKRTGSKLGSFFKRFLPSKKKHKVEEAPRPISAAEPPISNVHTSVTIPEQNTSSLDLFSDGADEDSSFKNLMDIDLVFDSLLLKSEQPQRSPDTMLIEQFNRCTTINPPHIEPPARSPRRPMLLKDSEGQFIKQRYGNRSAQGNPSDRIIQHLYENWRAVHFNAVVPNISTYSSTKKCRFNDEIYVNDTFSAMEYMRSDKAFLANRKELLKSRFIEGIKIELNEYKKREMLVHPNSSQYTHFFI